MGATDGSTEGTHVSCIVGKFVDVVGSKDGTRVGLTLGNEGN